MRRSLFVVVLAVALAVAAWVLFGSGGTGGPETSVERDVVTTDPSSSTVVEVDPVAARTEDRSDARVDEPEDPVSVASESAASDPPSEGSATARFTLIVLDDGRVPLQGAKAYGMVRAWRPGEERRAESPWDARNRGARNGRVAARASASDLVSDARGRIVLEVEDLDAAMDHVAELTVSPHRDMPFARARDVLVEDGETVTVVLERSGSLTVTLAPLAGGVTPHVYRPRRPRVAGKPVILNHADVRMTLVSEGGAVILPVRSDAIDSARWEELTPGRYRILAYTTGLGPAVPLAKLEDLVVEAGRPCDDPRLVRWNPFAEVEPMFVDVVRADGTTPDPLVVGYFFPGGSATVSENADYDGRRLPIVGPVGREARVFFEAEGTRRTVLEIEPGDNRRVVLEDAIRLRLRLVAPAEGLAGTEWIHFSRRRRTGAEGIGAFSTPIEVGGDTFEVELWLPGPGVYEGRSMTEGQTTFSSDDVMTIEPFEFEVEDAPLVERAVELRRRD